MRNMPTVKVLIEVVVLIWYSNPALDGRDPRPMQDSITLAPRLPDFHSTRLVNNQSVVFFNRFFPQQLKRLMVG